jgi:hypothetical protein
MAVVMLPSGEPHLMVIWLADELGSEESFSLESTGCVSGGWTEKGEEEAGSSASDESDLARIASPMGKEVSKLYGDVVTIFGVRGGTAEQYIFPRGTKLEDLLLYPELVMPKAKRAFKILMCKINHLFNPTLRLMPLCHFPVNRVASGAGGKVLYPRKELAGENAKQIDDSLYVRD